MGRDAADGGRTASPGIAAYSCAEGTDFDVRWEDNFAFGTFRGELVFEPGTARERRLVSAGGTDIFIASYEDARLTSLEHWGGSGDDGVLAVSTAPSFRVVAGWFTDQLVEDIGGRERVLSGPGLQFFQQVDDQTPVTETWPFAGLPPENLRAFEYSRFGTLIGGSFHAEFTLPNTSGAPIVLTPRGGVDVFAASYSRGLPPASGFTNYVQVGGPEDEIFGDVTYVQSAGGYGTWDWARGFVFVGSFQATAEATGTAPGDAMQSNGGFDGFIFTLAQFGGTGAPGESTLASFGGSGLEHFGRAVRYGTRLSPPVHVYGTFDSEEPIVFRGQSLMSQGFRDIVVIDDGIARTYGTAENDEVLKSGFVVGAPWADVLHTPDETRQLPFGPAAIADLEGPNVALGGVNPQLDSVHVDGVVHARGWYSAETVLAWDDAIIELPRATHPRFFVATVQRED